MKYSDLLTEEYEPYYADYISKSGELRLISALEKSLEITPDFFKSIPKEKLDYRYALGKWSIKEIIQHLIDAERVFAYRALRFAREDKTPLPGFDENSYVETAMVNERNIKDLLQEHFAQRQSTISLFKSFDDIMLTQIGTANQGKMSVRALGFVILGHENHHCEIIKERYLK